MRRPQISNGSRQRLLVTQRSDWLRSRGAGRYERDRQRRDYERQDSARDERTKLMRYANPASPRTMRKRFLRDEWPLIRERINALELDPKDLLKYGQLA